MFLLWSVRTFHWVLFHPSTKRRGSAVVREVLSSLATTSPPQTRLQTDASIEWGKQALSLPLLIDSGADESFIDTGVCNQLGIDTEPLPVPLEIKALNGMLLARVEHQTVPVLCLSGNHQEKISFHITDSPHVPLVLGLPWLKLCNPQINWSTGKIMSWN